MDALVVLDIGKTTVKLTVLDPNGKVLDERRRLNQIVYTGPYPHHDTDQIWEWIIDTLQVFSRQRNITAIIPITHGATAALVDECDLVLPVLDYEYVLPPELDRQYQTVRPAFADTFSPNLPAGLNLGRQLFWQKQAFPEEFSRARQILMYPQYWAWRLCGVAASEVTSLGCHTDLWQPLQKKFSSLVESMDWTDLFPPHQPAWAQIGMLRPELISRTGLPADCRIFCGIHDSNASLLRYISKANALVPRTVISTGTWVIAAALGKPLDILDEKLDMLANVNALGDPVACMRFMGGREFSILVGPDPQPCLIDDLQRLVSQGTLALPCFSETGGPFVGQVGTIVGPAPQTPQENYALATLYCALMTNYCLDALDADGPVVVDGSFTNNPHFSVLLAALRPQQLILFSDDSSGTTCGGWMLGDWARRMGDEKMGLQIATAIELDGWELYKNQWSEMVNFQRQETVQVSR